MGEQVKRGPGRPPSNPQPEGAKKGSFWLDPETFRLFKVYLARRGMTMQGFIETQVRETIRYRN